MIDRNHELPVKRQAELVGISRGTVYYQPEPVSQAELALMRRIDELHLEHPFAGSRMLRDFLRLQGIEVGRRRVGTLMRRMGIQALYRKLNTSKRHPAHPVFPYLLRGLGIERANQVWALDITYIPMARGWVYLVAVLDWASRRVLAHRVSITMEADFCVEALREAAARWGAPEIVNTDQGSQFSSAEFVADVQRIGARQSMDGKGCWRDKDYASYCTSFAPSDTGTVAQAELSPGCAKRDCRANPVLRGWGQYFRSGNAAGPFTAVDGYVVRRLKSLRIKRAGRHLKAGQAQRWDREYYEQLGLYRLRGTIRYPAPAFWKQEHA